MLAGELLRHRRWRPISEFSRSCRTLPEEPDGRAVWHRSSSQTGWHTTLSWVHFDYRLLDQNTLILVENGLQTVDILKFERKIFSWWFCWWLKLAQKILQCFVEWGSFNTLPDKYLSIQVSLVWCCDVDCMTDLVPSLTFVLVREILSTSIMLYIDQVSVAVVGLLMIASEMPIIDIIISSWSICYAQSQQRFLKADWLVIQERSVVTGYSESVGLDLRHRYFSLSDSVLTTRTCNWPVTTRSEPTCFVYSQLNSTQVNAIKFMFKKRCLHMCSGRKTKSYCILLLQMFD